MKSFNYGFKTLFRVSQKHFTILVYIYNGKIKARITQGVEFMFENIVQAVIISVICLVITTLVGIIGYFLKQTMARVDANEKDVAEIKENYEPTKNHDKDIKAFNETKKE